VAGVRGQRDREEHEAERGESDARPLARADGVAEPALREHREEHEPAGDHGLDDRQGRERQGGDVESPRADGDEHADGEPLGPEQPDRAGDRMLHADVRSRAGAAVLQEEAHVRGERAEQSKKNPD